MFRLFLTFLYYKTLGDGFLRSCGNDFGGCGVRRGRRGELCSGQVLLSQSSHKMGVSIVPASWEDVRMKEEPSVKAENYLQVAGAHSGERSAHVPLTWPWRGLGVSIFSLDSNPAC